MSYYIKMTKLALSFPALRAAPIEPFDYKTPEKLDRWACSGEPSSGAIYAAQFILELFDPREKWKSGHFRLMDAMGTWDAEHRAAFLAWANDHWWP